jgi:hypothetical protein
MQRPRSGGLSRRDVDALYPSMRDAHDYMRSRRDASRAGSPVATLVGAAEVGAGALGLGYLYGRTQHWNIPGTPIPMGLAAGVAGHLLSLFVLGDSKWAGHVSNLSNGAIASWTTMLGAGLGTQARQAAGQPTAPITAGMFGCCGSPAPAPPQLQAAPLFPQNVTAGMRGRPAPLTEAEVAALSRQIR